MLRCCNFLTVLLLLSPAISVGRVPSGDSPAFTAVPELSAGFDLLYEQKFAEARQTFVSWESRNLEDPFGEVAVAASYLFEELYFQGVLTSDFFLNEKRFLHGIDGRPNPVQRRRHRAQTTLGFTWARLMQWQCRRMGRSSSAATSSATT